MNTTTELIDGYIAMWNETDAKRRRELIARVWTEDATYVDPKLKGEGAAGIDAMVKTVHDHYAGHRFTRTSAVEEHNGRVRFTWNLGPESGPLLASGTDFGVIADGRLKAITGFFDPAPAVG